MQTPETSRLVTNHPSPNVQRITHHFLHAHTRVPVDVARGVNAVVRIQKRFVATAERSVQERVINEFWQLVGGEAEM